MMVLDEVFHRLKRTSLMASTALLVTFVPGISAADSGGLIGLSFKEVQPAYLRYGLWIAAAYYTVGFLMEFWEARNAHAPIAVEDAADKVGSAVQKLSDTSGMMETILRQLAETEARTAGLVHMTPAEVRKHSEQVLRNWSSMLVPELQALFQKTPHELLDPVIHEPTLLAETVRSEILRVAKARHVELIDLPRRLSGQFEELTTQTNQHVSEFKGQAELYLTAARSLHTRMNRLSNTIKAVRKLKFVGWELGGVAVPFLLGTALLLWKHNPLAAVIDLVMDIATT